MTIVACLMCDQIGCTYCRGVGFVENGEHLPPDLRPVADPASDWPEEPTQEMPVFVPKGKEAA